MKNNTMNDRMLTVGTRTLTYEMGKIVAIEILEAKPAFDAGNIYGPEYKVCYIGMLPRLLDAGQKWWLNEGDVFVTHHNNIEAAMNDSACFNGVAC